MFESSTQTPAQKADGSWDREADQPLEKRATPHKIKKVTDGDWTEVIDEVTGKAVAGFSSADTEAAEYWQDREVYEVE